MRDQHVVADLARSFPDAPVMGVSDCNPQGITILAVRKYGALKRRFPADTITTPGLVRLALWFDDLASQANILLEPRLLFFS